MSYNIYNDNEVATTESTHGKTKAFRKAARKEIGGQPYPLFDLNVKNMADFGLGVSVYLLQLFLLAGLSLIAGLIMIPAILEYADYDEGKSADFRLKGTAACAFRLVEITNCTRSHCEEEFREFCPLSNDAVIADIVMCCVFACLFYVNMFVDRLEDKLDEAVQTSQDYSVVVMDPPADGLDPEEYRRFFGRFGRVRNVTITKKNKKIVDLLISKRRIMRALHPQHVAALQDKTVVPAEYPAASFGKQLLQRIGLMRDDSYWVGRLCDVNARLQEASKMTYEACRVFVSFEAEQEQRLCLRELDVSLLNAIKDTGVTEERKLFRSTHILEVAESAEPSNILWMNLELHYSERKLRFVAGWLLSLGVYATSYFLIEWTYTNNPNYVPLLIGGIDTCLPMIFVAITNIENHVDEDDRQNSLLFKLFGGKILTSVVFVFINTSPVMLLDNTEIIRIINTQLSASFVAPFIKAMDFYGMFMRYVVAPMIATTQAEMIKYYEGSHFILADRYTEVSKIMFISLFYSFIIPTGLWIATVACLTLFVADKYALLRKTRQPPLLDSTMAKTVRTYTLFAVAVHMWMTCRFIYSWPFDTVEAVGSGTYKLVDKRAPYSLLRMHTQSWQSDSQKSLFQTYKLAAIIIISIVLYVIIIEPVILFLREFFWKESKEETSKCSFKLYTSISGMVAYCPVVSMGAESFMVADTSNMLARHKPDTVCELPNEDPNLGNMLPADVRPYTLAVVKWYPPDEEIGEESAKDLEAKSTRDILYDALKESLGLMVNDLDDARVPTESVFRRPLRRGLRVGAATKSSNIDVVHIEMTEPQWDITSRSVGSGVIGEEEQKEMQTMRGEEPSRIRKSMAALKVTRKLNKVMTESNEPKENPPVEAKDISAFGREELYLLRQMRREVLDADPEANIWKKNERPDDAPPNYLTFNEFVQAVDRVAPSSLERSSKVQRNASKFDIQTARRYSKTLLRRIYVKFLTMQPAVQTDGNHEELLHWPVFVAFVQTGGAAAMFHLEKK